MALTTELPRLVKDLKAKAETVSYGELWVRTHATDTISPIAQLGKSLDPGEENKRSSQKKNDASITNRQAETKPAQNKTRLVVFEIPKDLSPNSPSPFRVEPVNPVIIEQSGLSQVIGHVSKLDVMVFIPCTGSKKPLQLKVPQTTTFAQLTVLAVKKWNEMATKKLPEEYEAWLVRIATEDGQIDDLFPVEVSMKQQVDKWLNQPFLLMENPRYEKKEGHGDDKAGSDQKVVIKAYLPKGDYHTLYFELNTKMSKVLKAFCEKRSLHPNDYTLQSLSDPPTYINRDMRVADLKDYSVRLVPKADLTIADSDEVEIFWYDSLAQAFKTYSVTFIKGSYFDRKQERILGIDGERITQTVVKKKGQNKQLPPVSIKEVTDAYVHEDKPTYFTVEFRDKPSVYEAQTPNIAREIVGKIQHLLAIIRRQSK